MASGEVQKCQADKQTLIIAAECECGSGKIIEMTFTLGNKTKVTLDGKDVRLSDLKKGDRVEVEYQDVDDVKTVKATR